MIKSSNLPIKSLTKSYLMRKYFREKTSLGQIAAEYNCSPSNIAYWMSKYGLARRNCSEATYNYFNKKECFRITHLSQSEKLLKNIGLILYWCEGVNKEKRLKMPTTLAFTNTDVGMLKIWLKFLNAVCKLRSDKIKIRLYLHKNQNGEKMKKYWSHVLGIPTSQFENVSYTKKNSTYEGYNGTVKIKVHNVKLYQLIKEWIRELQYRVLRESF